MPGLAVASAVDAFLKGVNEWPMANGTTAQAAYVYKTLSGGDYERLTLDSAVYSAAAYLRLRAESAGTGAANINLVLGPKGTGALVAQMPDGTAAGGNARGTNAVDLQANRSQATLVASGGLSTIGGGSDNSATSSYATVPGGSYNKASGLYSIASGRQNTASGLASGVFSGFACVAAASYAAILGGQSNTITAGATHAAIPGGQSNSISAAGLHAFVGGGLSNQANAQYAAVCGGNINIASGAYSFIGSGLSNNNAAAVSVIGGGNSNQIVGGANYAVIVGGVSNTAAATHGFIGSGYLNGILNGASYATICGGYDNDINAAGLYAFIGGGKDNDANASSAVVCGGELNVASGGHSFIGGGANNNATGQYAAVVAGSWNTASSTSAVVLGNASTASGAYSACLGGGWCAASAQYSATLGCNTKANRLGQLAFSMGAFTVQGDSQVSRLNLRVKTADATPKLMTLNPTDSTHLDLTIASGQTAAFMLHVWGAKSDGTAFAHYTRRGRIKNVGGTTALVGTVETIGTDHEDTAGCDIAVTANSTTDAIDITVTGIAAETWRWLGTIELLELNYGT